MLPREQAESLHNALLAAFPDIAQLQPFVRYQLGWELSHFQKSTLRETIYKLIQEAESQGYVERLVAAVAEKRSNLDEVRSMMRLFQSTSPTSLSPISDMEEAEAVSPVGSPMYLLNTPLSDTLPFDIGTAWGLNQGSFVGLVLTQPSSNVYEPLVRATRALRDTVHYSEIPLRPPERFWIRMNIDMWNAAGPVDACQLWSQALDQTRVLIRSLRQDGLPEAVDLGFYFNLIGVDNSPAQDAAALARWYRWVSELFPTQQIAIVVALPFQAETYARRFADAWKGYGPQQLYPPIEIAQIKDDYHWTQPAEMPHGDADFAEDPLIAPPLGRDVCMWMYHITITTGQMTLRQPAERAKYQVIIELYQQLRKDFPAINTKPWAYPGAAAQVVDNMDQIVSDGSTESDRQLLELTATYAPGRLPELIMAYAKSARPQARLTALSFARRADSLLDAWLMGVDWNMEYLPAWSELSRQDRVRFHEDITLALLRRYHQQPSADLVSAIETFRDVWSRELERLCALCLGYTPSVPLDLLLNARWVSLAARSGLAADLILDHIADLSLESPVPWWLLNTFPPTPEMIGRILTLSPPRRAIFGLCTSQEWTSVQADSDEALRIIACRRDRFLYYRS